MIVVFYYYDSRSGKYWPGPEGHSIETERFSSGRIAPKIVLWRNQHWVMDEVLILIETKPGFESRVIVHYVRASFDKTKDGHHADDPPVEP